MNQALELKRGMKNVNDFDSISVLTLNDNFRLLREAVEKIEERLE